MAKIFNSEKYEGEFNGEIKLAIKEAAEKLDLVFTRQYVEYKKYCDRLMAYAADEQSDYLYALGYYYLLEYYFTDNDLDNASSCALEGIKYQRKIGEYELVVRSYNLLGCVAVARNEVANAVEYFRTSIDYCNTYNFDYVRYMPTANLASLFQKSKCYDRALYYYEEAEKYLRKSLDTEGESEHLTPFITISSNKGYCQLAIGNIDAASECGEELMGYLEQMEKQEMEYSVFFVYAYLARLEYKKGNLELMDKYLEGSKTYIDTTDNYTACIDDLEEYIGLYMDLGRYDEAVGLLEHYLHKCELEKPPFHIYRAFLLMRIKCAESVQNNEDYIKYSRLFFKLKKEDGSLNADAPLRAENMYRENARMLKQQYELQLVNERLLVEAQHDTLTGLPNRSYMNSYAGELMDKAFKNNESFGIEIIDIDYFKQINDRYGHMSGDKYLVSMAEILQKIIAEYDDVFTARYGGDEFVVIYYGKTNEQVGEIMAQIKAYAMLVPISDRDVTGSGYLTLSQGCFNKVPKKLNRLWDYFSEADITLYDVKKSGRNGHRLRVEFGKNNV